MGIKAYIAVALSLFIASNLNAEEISRVQIYLDYERAYLNNDANKVSKWMPDDFELIQTLHIPNYGPDSVKAPKKVLLQNMRKSAPSKFPRSTAENVSIEDGASGAFCARSILETKTVVSGKNYLEKEVRKACFKQSSSHMLVTKHTIDVYFEPI